MILNTKNIQIAYDRSVNPSQIDIGMQHENGVTKILFEFGEEFNFTDERLYFIVTDGGVSFAYPLVDNAVVVGSEITQKKAYTANFVISKSEIKDSIDKNNVMWISNDIRLMVTLNSINVESIESEVLPIQFQIIYDDLLDLKKDLEDKLGSGYFKGEKGDPGEVGPKGDPGEKGDPGQDYVLTDNDKSEIAGVVKAEVSEDINNLNNKTDELKGDIANKLEKANDMIYIGNIVNNKWQQSNGNEYSGNYRYYLSANVQPNTKYYVSGMIINSSFPLIVMFDENNNVIGAKETSGDNTPINDYEFITPSNCVKISVNGKKGNNYPSLYYIQNKDLNGNDFYSLINSKQNQIIEWKKADYEYEKK